MSTTLRIYDKVGGFAENKDVASELRRGKIWPLLQAGKSVVIDFQDVTLATQSFIHVLLSDVIRQDPAKALDLLSFRNCSNVIKSTIALVAEYTQDGLNAPAEQDEGELAGKGRARDAGRPRPHHGKASR